MTRPPLDDLVLQECEVRREDEIPDLPWTMTVYQLQIEPLGRGRIAADVGFLLWVPREDSGSEHKEDDDDPLEVSATFRLTYGKARSRSIEDPRAFAVSVALADAWPAWRQWLCQTLALMGLDQLRIPGTVPKPISEAADRAFGVWEQLGEARGR